MKNLKYLLLIIFFAVLHSCADEEEGLILNENSVPAPSEVNAVFTISDDNTGIVTVTPAAVSATTFEILFGDVSEEEPSFAKAGETLEHVYAEGNYTLTITAVGATGLKTSTTKDIVVSFNPPANLDFTVEVNELAVVVAPTADDAFSFDVYFGENPDAEPVQVMPGETAAYTYAADGTYEIRVVAIGAAIATSELTKTVDVAKIVVPLVKAPTPTLAENAVISIYSDAYTDVALSELPTEWSGLGGFEEITVQSDNVWKLSNIDFMGIVTNYSTGIDLSTMTTLHIDYWVPEGTTNEFFVKIVNTVDGGEAQASLGTTVADSWQSIDIPMTEFDALANKTKITQILIDANPEAGALYVDNFYFYNENEAGGANLLANGDFENGASPWTVGVGTDPAPVVTDGGNSYYSVNITSPDPGQPFLVNLSQKLEIISGTTYVLTFDAWSDRDRSIIAGIGLSGGDFSNNSVPVNITATRDTYRLILAADGFGAPDARVLFDSNGEAGLVNIDDVSLTVYDDGLLTNGNFENGSDSWLAGVGTDPAPVVTDGGNTFYSVDITSPDPGQPFLVNLSQKLEIVNGVTYRLTFNAWSDRDRNIIAGIGLSGGDFSNNSVPVSITADKRTYMLELTATGFGAPDARVLFDNNGDAGLVNIDDVILEIVQ